MAVTRCREWLQQKLRSSGKPLPFSLASLEAKNKQSAETAICPGVVFQARDCGPKISEVMQLQ